MTTKTATKQTRKAAKTAANPAVEAAEKFGAEARRNVEENSQKMRKGLESAAAFNQANVEALVASSTIAAKAMENMTSEIAAYTKKSYEDGMAAAKAMSSCRDVSELVQKQAEFQRSSLESFVNEATRLNELYAAAAKDAFDPIGKRFTAAVDIVKDYRF
jgi:phasin family protein